MDMDRWARLMTAFGFGDNSETYHALVAAYSEAHRHYHGMTHVSDCLQHLDRCVARIDHPEEVELALWFHDAIYKPLSGKNERNSAAWAVSFLSENAVTGPVAGRIERLIMASLHDTAPSTKDESYLIDIDLAILGADAVTYEKYEQAIRKEYQIVPGFLYRKKRAALLQGFLDRPSIYGNEPFRSECEQRARVNLTNAIARLTGRT